MKRRMKKEMKKIITYKLTILEYLYYCQNVHFNLSSFIETIIKNNGNDSATRGNGYNMNDPFLDDSELQDNFDKIRDREIMEDHFYVDRMNKPKPNKSKHQDSSETDFKDREKDMEEKSDEEDDDEINVLKTEIENELNSLEQYVNYFHTDLKSQSVDDRINSVDILIQKSYNQKRPKIYIDRLCKIFKVNKKEIKKKLNELTAKNKMKEIEGMKEKEIKELVKKMIREYENQSINYSFSNVLLFIYY